METNSDLALNAAAADLNVPLHGKVRDLLRRIIDTEFEDGNKFYTERELIRRLSVSQPTVRRALSDLAGEGRLIAKPRKGFFVQKRIPLRFTGFFQPSAPPAFPSMYPNSMFFACQECNCKLQIYYAEEEKLPENIGQIRKKPLEERIVISGFSMQQTMAFHKNLADAGYRSVVMDGMPPSFEGDVVMIDQDALVVNALDHLKGLGHSDILIVLSEPKHLTNISERTKALRTFAGEGIRFLECDIGKRENSFEATCRAMHEVFADRGRIPTALCPVSGAGAWASMRVLAEKGLNVPEDVSVVSLNPTWCDDLLPIPLTGVDFSMKEYALKVVETLWRDSVAPVREQIKPGFVVRASTSGPRLS